MTTLPLSTQIPILTQFTSLMLPVLKLFQFPVGVMLARANDLAWPVTTGLYLQPAVVSDSADIPHILRQLADHSNPRWPNP